MAKQVSNLFLTLLILMGIVQISNAQSVTTDLAPAEYSFMLGGHLYGMPSGSNLPAASLLSHLDTINNSGIDFFVSLGDNYRNPDSTQISLFDWAFIQKLNCTYYFTPGNHDAQEYESMTRHFQEWPNHFNNDQDLFLLLDSEKDSGYIKQDQQEYIRQFVNDSNEYRYVFIMMHKLLWTIGDSNHQIVYNNTNALDGFGYPKETNFADDVFPVIRELAAKAKEVVLVSGDIGVQLPKQRKGFSLFYEKEENSNIHFLATGIGDNPDDVLVQVFASDDGLKFVPFSLGTRDWKEAEHYGTDFWMEYFKDPIVQEEVVEDEEGYLNQIQSILASRKFWLGTLFGFLGVILLFGALRRRRK